MKKNKKFKTFLYLVLLFFFVLCFQTIAYSAINSTMNVSGDAYARAEADVRITNFRLSNLTNATSHYEEFGKNHIITEVDLNDTSSQITYYLEITNYGSVDIGIYDITGLPSGVNYSIKDYNLHDKICDDTGKCNSFIKKTFEITLTTTSSYSGQVRLNFDFRSYHTVTYTDITNNNYPTEVIDGGTLSITFKEDLKRVQILSSDNELAFYEQISNEQNITINNISNDVSIRIKEKVAKLVSGILDNVGSEMCIDTECFYVISYTEDTITMLSKYNLHVANQYDGTTLTKIENPTGIQDESARGWFDGYDATNPIIGTTPYSSTNYWSNITSYPANVYSDQSYLYEYVNNYSSYLKQLNATVKEARLITYSELISLGCESGECTAAPEWVYSTSYWTGTANTSTTIWRLDSQGRYNDNNETNNGVRPVITISKSDIIETIDFVLDGTTYTAEVGMTWTDWGESEYNTFTKWGTSLTFYSTYINCPVGDSYYVCNSNSYSDTTNPSDKIIAGHTYYMVSNSPDTPF